MVWQDLLLIKIIKQKKLKYGIKIKKNIAKIKVIKLNLGQEILKYIFV